MSDLPPDLRAFLRTNLSLHDPHAGDRARVGRALGARLAVALSDVPPPAEGPATPAGEPGVPGPPPAASPTGTSPPSPSPSAGPGPATGAASPSAGPPVGGAGAAGAGAAAPLAGGSLPSAAPLAAAATPAGLVALKKLVIAGALVGLGGVGGAGLALRTRPDAVAPPSASGPAVGPSGSPLEGRPLAPSAPGAAAAALGPPGSPLEARPDAPSASASGEGAGAPAPPSARDEVPAAPAGGGARPRPTATVAPAPAAPAGPAVDGERARRDGAGGTPGGAPPPASGTGRAAPPSTLAEELALVRTAREELRAGNAARALGLLDAHGERFAEGALAEERDATRVRALCRLGQGARAVEAASTFAARWPRSPYAAGVRAGCAEALGPPGP
jgi:hypothetical protein